MPSAIQFVEMAKDYVKRTKGETTLFELCDMATNNEVYMDDKGFFIYSVYRDEFWCHYIYAKKVGDIDHLIKIGEEIARALGARVVKVLTPYPKAIEKRYGYKPTQTLMVKEVR
ncbi:hypothetical protein [Anaeroselena agilis]|uniref:Uncharacterized protein n=1 Tax=Anaeroselena agilis TaxID=3063788 RepID=A0ABU3NVW2_9FIRM|nr:hypothetical protein [Selenomonadales bacterium 4137-cl]